MKYFTIFRSRVAVVASATVGATLLAILVACGGDGVATSPKDNPTGMLASLTANATAVTLAADSTQAAVSQWQIVVTPRDFRGAAITTGGKVTYTTSDISTVSVDSNGLVRALSPTVAGPVTVTARLTVPESNVTKSVAITVVVTSAVTPLSSFAMPRDSNKVGAGYEKSMAVIATDSQGDQLTGLNVRYTSSNLICGTVNDTGWFASNAKGTVTLTASGVFYGVTKRDSVTITVTDPLVFEIDVMFDPNDPNYGSLFAPDTITIKAGQGVKWVPIGGAGDAIAFDDPTNVPGGDIPYFYNIKVMRMFPVAGNYGYGGVYGGHRGMVIVKP